MVGNSGVFDEGYVSPTVDQTPEGACVGVEGLGAVTCTVVLPLTSTEATQTVLVLPLTVVGSPLGPRSAGSPTEELGGGADEVAVAWVYQPQLQQCGNGHLPA